MMKPKCLICKKFFRSDTQVGDADGTDPTWYWVCPKCLRHAEIGRRLEVMPEGVKLEFCDHREAVPQWVVATYDEILSQKKTPLEALQAAKIGGE